MNIVRLINVLILYIVFSFAEWDFNISHWGMMGRLLFIILTIVICVIWWFIGLIPSNKEKPQFSNSIDDLLKEQQKDKT